MLAAGHGQVADDVQAVASAGGPSRHDADDHLGHEADEALHLEDVESAGAAGIDRVGVVAVGIPIAIAPPDALVATRTE